MRNLITMAVGLCFSLPTFAMTGIPVKTQSIEHVVKMERRQDGNFDVTCIDYSVEVRTAEEVADGEVCDFKTTKQVWTQKKGGTVNGMKFCDVNLEKTEKNDSLIAFSMNFTSPCSETKSSSLNCTGDSCLVSIEGINYLIEFQGDYDLKLTRQSDNLSGEFEKSNRY